MIASEKNSVNDQHLEITESLGENALALIQCYDLGGGEIIVR